MSTKRRWLSLLVCVLLPLPVAADELPPRAVARLGDYRFYHGNFIGCAAISHDGRRVATGSLTYLNSDVEMRPLLVLWDTTTGDELRRWKLSKGAISTVVFSPDGKQLIVGVDGKDETANAVLVYDCATGKLVRSLEKFKKAVIRVQYSRDGKHLHISEREGAVSSWDAVTGKQLRTWEPMPKPARADDATQKTWDVRVGVLSPDEKVLLWCLWRWDAPSEKKGEQQCQVGGGYYIVRGYDTSTDKELYEVRDADFGLYQLGRVMGQILPQPHAGPFSADGKRIAVQGDPFLARDAFSGKMLHERKEDDDDPIMDAAWSPDGKRAAVFHFTCDLRLWDLETGKVILNMRPKPSSAFSAFDISADGKTLLAATSTTVRLWDLTTGKERTFSPGHRQPVQSVWFSADGRTLVSQCEERICHWDLVRQKETSSKELTQAGKDERLLARSPDGRFDLMLVGDDGAVQVRQVGKSNRAFEKLTPEFMDDAGFSHTGDKVVFLNADKGGGLEWFDATTGKRLGKYLKAKQARKPVFSADSRFLAWATTENTIVVAPTAGGRVSRIVPAPPRDTAHPQGWEEYALVALSADGEYVAAAADARYYSLEDDKPVPLRIFQVRTGADSVRLLGRASDTIGRVDALALTFSPDGRLLAVADERTNAVYLLETVGGGTRAEFRGHRDVPTVLAFSADGKMLASGGNDNVIYLWDVTGTRTKGRDMEDGTPEKMDLWWQALSRTDAARAGEALAALIRTSQRSVPYLMERLHSVAAADTKHVKRLIADLDADAFEKRETASRELSQLGERAEGAIRQALKNRPPPEAKRRLEELVEKLDNRSLAPEELQALRAVEALEHIGTPEARKLLETLATGAPEARLTRDAKASLKRLEK